MANNLENGEHHFKAAPDISKRANVTIWVYFILLGVLLFITILGLTVYFRVQLQEEKLKKIGEVQTQEILNYKAFYKPIIAGEKGILEGKKNISIQEAMKIFIYNIRLPHHD